jgi:putative transcriptional regulator
MTQKALAEQVGISRQTMNAIENCRHAPTVSVAIRIADVFQVSVDYLFALDYEGKPTRPKQPAKGAIDQPQATTEKPVELEARRGPPERAGEAEFSPVDLRGVIGS